MNKILFVKLGIALFWVCFNVKQSYAVSSESSYSFPFKQGSKEWNNYKSTIERMHALQIPQDTLPILSTENLLELCLDFPYLLDFYSYSDMAEGLKSVYSNFNGFGELFQREDLTEAIISKLLNFPEEMKIMEDMSEIEQGDFAAKQYVLKNILYRQQENNSVDEKQTKELEHILPEINSIMKNHPNIFDSSNLYFKPNLEKSYGNPAVGDTTIHNNGYKYILVKRKTPYNNDVWAAELAEDDFSPATKSSLRNYVESTYGVIWRGDATKTYNCHAYAWHVHEGGDNVWIGNLLPSDEDIYWEDGSYIEVSNISEATHVSYENEHSAIVLGNGNFLSKWGCWPLVEHAPDNTPVNNYGYLIYGYPNKYYRRAKIIGDVVPSCSSVYEVEGLPSYYSVTWSLENQPTLSSSLITQNTPSNNKCTIVNNGIDFYDTNLVASIQKNGQAAATLKKHIQSDIPVTFSQQGCTYNGVVYPDIPESPVTKNGNIFVNKSCWVTLKSSYFTSMNVSYTGATILWGQLNDGSISLKFPYSSGTSFIDVNATGGCRNFSFRIYARTGSIPIPSLEVNPIANGYEILLSCQDENGEKIDLKNEVDLQWDLFVYNATSGELMFKKHTRSCAEEINTSFWPSGLYVARAEVYGQEAICKIIVNN